jgi:hypothetical protein
MSGCTSLTCTYLVTEPGSSVTSPNILRVILLAWYVQVLACGYTKHGFRCVHIKYEKDKVMDHMYAHYTHKRSRWRKKPKLDGTLSWIGGHGYNAPDGLTLFNNDELNSHAQRPWSWWELNHVAARWLLHLALPYVTYSGSGVVKPGVRSLIRKQRDTLRDDANRSKTATLTFFFFEKTRALLI